MFELMIPGKLNQREESKEEAEEKNFYCFNEIVANPDSGNSSCSTCY